MSSAAQRQSRRRRRDDVKSSVRAATLELVRDTPFKDLTIDEIARGAGLTRSAFYFYFRDKHELLMAAVEDVVAALYREADRWWHGDGDGEQLIREALAGVAAVYTEHATLLRVATKVSTYDDEVREFWRSLVERFITATASHLRREQDAGRARPLDPDRTAESLVWMTERSCYMYLTRGERDSRELVDALAPVWAAALYPAPPPD